MEGNYSTIHARSTTDDQTGIQQKNPQKQPQQVIPPPFSMENIAWHSPLHPRAQPGCQGDEEVLMQVCISYSVQKTPCKIEHLN